MNNLYLLKDCNCNDIQLFYMAHDTVCELYKYQQISSMGNNYWNEIQYQ